jgi:peptidoglycan-N-acetylglucosamine deacetylase
VPARPKGWRPIQWDVSTGDPSPTTSAREIAATMINRTRPGSIIIAHANGRGHHTADALPAAIAGLRAKGFEFVTVGELLAAGRPVVVPTCYDSRPGDTDKYDKLFAPRPASGANPWAPKAQP